MSETGGYGANCGVSGGGSRQTAALLDARDLQTYLLDEGGRLSAIKTAHAACDVWRTGQSFFDHN